MKGQISAAALLALLVVVAGCAGTNQLTSPNEPTDGELPPGVSETRVENASALFDAHALALEESGYASRLERNRSVDGNNESQPEYDEWRHQTTRMEGGEYHGVATVVTGFSRPGYNETSQFDYWWNNSTAFVRFDAGNETRYDRLDQPTGIGSAFVSDTWYLWGLLDDGEFVVDGVDRTLSGTRITLTSTGNGTRAEAASSYDATVVVDSAGRIHSATEHATYDTDEGTVTVHTRYERTTTGLRSVADPDWLDEARMNRTGV